MKIRTFEMIEVDPEPKKLCSFCGQPLEDRHCLISDWSDDLEHVPPRGDILRFHQICSVRITDLLTAFLTNPVYVRASRGKEGKEDRKYEWQSHHYLGLNRVRRRWVQTLLNDHADPHHNR